MAVVGVTSRAQLVRLFEFEPGLLRDVPVEQARLLTQQTVATCLGYESGSVRLPADLERSGAVAAVVLDGILVRRVEAFDRAAAEVVGVGDVLTRDVDDDPTAAEPTWRTLESVRIALLDDEWIARVTRWPQVVAALMHRLNARGTRLAEQMALSQIRDLDERLLRILGFLARRWGTVGPTGVTVDLPLDHGLLAALASAQRPSVTTSLGRLEARGLVRRSAARRLVLSGGEAGDGRRPVLGRSASS